MRASSATLGPVKPLFPPVPPSIRAPPIVSTSNAVSRLGRRAAARRSNRPRRGQQRQGHKQKQKHGGGGGHVSVTLTSTISGDVVLVSGNVHCALNPDVQMKYASAHPHTGRARCEVQGLSSFDTQNQGWMHQHSNAATAAAHHYLPPGLLIVLQVTRVREDGGPIVHTYRVAVP